MYDGDGKREPGLDSDCDFDDRRRFKDLYLWDILLGISAWSLELRVF